MQAILIEVIMYKDIETYVNVMTLAAAQQLLIGALCCIANSNGDLDFNSLKGFIDSGFVDDIAEVKAFDDENALDDENEE